MEVVDAIMNDEEKRVSSSFSSSSQYQDDEDQNLKDVKDFQDNEELKGESFLEGCHVLYKKLVDLVKKTRKTEAQNWVYNQKLEEEKEDSNWVKGRDLSSRNKKNDETLEEKYRRIAQTHKDLDLKFSALSSTISAAQKSSVMAQILGIKKREKNEQDTSTKNIFVEELDQEEIDFVKELAEEQVDLSRETIAQQEKIISSEMNLINLRQELVLNFSKSREFYNQLDISKEDHDSLEQGKESSSKVQTKKSQLLKEEHKLNQLRYFVQNFMHSTEKMGLNFDDETNQRNKEMLLRCGMKIPELRATLYE